MLRKVEWNGERKREIKGAAIMRGHKHTKPNYVQSIYFSAKGKTPIISVYSSSPYCYYTFASGSYSNVTIFSNIMRRCQYFLVSASSSLIWLWFGIVNSLLVFLSIVLRRSGKRTGFVIRRLFDVVKNRIWFGKKTFTQKYLYFIHTVFVLNFLSTIIFHLTWYVLSQKRKSAPTFGTKQRKYHIEFLVLRICPSVEPYNRPHEHRWTTIAVGRSFTHFWLSRPTTIIFW